jgi:hypothetical protein
LTTSLEPDWEEVEEDRLDWVFDRLELELEAGLREAPDTAVLTVWLTRGLIWLTMLDTMSDWLREEEDCWLEPLLEPEENPELEPKPLELEPKLDEDPEPKLDEELEPKLDDPEEKLEPDPEENPEPDDEADEELKDDWGLSLIWTKFSWTSLVSV